MKLLELMAPQMQSDLSTTPDTDVGATNGNKFPYCLLYNDTEYTIAMYTDVTLGEDENGMASVRQGHWVLADSLMSNGTNFVREGHDIFGACGRTPNDAIASFMELMKNEGEAMNPPPNIRPWIQALGSTLNKPVSIR